MVLHSVSGLGKPLCSQLLQPWQLPVFHRQKYVLLTLVFRVRVVVVTTSNLYIITDYG